MAIVFEDVSYTYNSDTPWSKPALRNVSLRIDDGEFVGVAGPTGSGKSTLIQHMNGLLHPNSGRVSVNGVEVGEERGSLKELRKQVGMVFQYPEHQLFEETLGDDIAFGPRNLELEAEEVEMRVEWACSAVGLDRQLLDRSPFELSGGQMRRAAIAGVLAMKCEVLILDEPTAGLDPRGRADIIGLLDDLNSGGMTVVMVSHSLDVLAELADKMVVLSRGQVVLSGPTREVFRHPEKLREVSLDVPQVTGIMQRLRRKGLAVSSDVLTVEEAADVLMEVLQ